MKSKTYVVEPSKRIIRKSIDRLKIIQTKANLEKLDANDYDNIIDIIYELNCMHLVEKESYKEAVEIMLNKYGKEDLKWK